MKQLARFLPIVLGLSLALNMYFIYKTFKSTGPRTPEEIEEYQRKAAEARFKHQQEMIEKFRKPLTVSISRTSSEAIVLNEPIGLELRLDAQKTYTNLRYEWELPSGVTAAQNSKLSGKIDEVEEKGTFKIPFEIIQTQAGSGGKLENKEVFVTVTFEENGKSSEIKAVFNTNIAAMIEQKQNEMAKNRMRQMQQQMQDIKSGRKSK